MVAKINVGSSLYGVLAYNSRKVDLGVGVVVCSNRVAQSPDGVFDIARCARDFERCMPKDFRTEKPVIHISLNPHPDDVLSDSDLASIATEYIERLGYGCQPYVVFRHNDTGRTHLHIVSLRVDGEGHKIDDRYEHRRSKDITRLIEKKYGLKTAEKGQKESTSTLKTVDVSRGDVKQQVANIVKYAMTNYHFRSFNEFRALLTVFNVCAEEVAGVAGGRKYSGIVYSALDRNGHKVGNPFISSLFGKNVGFEAVAKRCERSDIDIIDKNLQSRMKSIIFSAINKGFSRNGFERFLKDNGINVIFRINDTGRIYGVTFIDHLNGCVANGSRLGKLFSANAFQQRFEATYINERKETAVPDKEMPTGDNDAETDFQKNENSFIEDYSGLLSLHTHGVNPEEEAFARRMQRKKNKKRFRQNYY